MIEGAIFDMDGLMFDSERVWGTLWQPALAAFGLTVPEGLPDAARGTTGDAALAVIRRFCGPDVNPEAIFAEFYHQADLVFAKGVPPKPGLFELLDYFGEHGIPMAVASSSSEPLIRNNLERAGIAGRFATVVPGKEVVHSKPAPDIFLEAARRLGVNPSRALVLEDSFPGVRAGAAGGFVTVMVPDTMAPTDEIRALATRVCASLTEVRALLEAGEL